MSSFDFDTEQPWVVEPPEPLRVRFVSPTGSEDGSSRDKPMALNSALSTAQAGDLHWLLAGTYTGSFETQAAGNSSHPIIWRA